MRRAAKADANQNEIIRAFRQIGANVQVLSQVGHGCPDLLIGLRGRNILVELKNPKGRGVRLTADQIEWHKTWSGQVCIADSIEQALKLVVDETMK